MKNLLLIFVGLALATTIAYSQNNQSKTTQSNKQSNTASGYVNDSAITLAVKTKLLGTKNLTSTDITVTTNNGVVELTGTVPTEAEKMTASRVAKQAAGVKSVKNNLAIRNSDNENTDSDTND